MIQIQTLTTAGHWITVRKIYNINSQYTRRQMEFLKSQRPHSPVRAIDSKGQILELI